MKRVKSPLALAVFLIGAASTLTYGQDKAITIGDIPPSVSNRAFTNTPVWLLKKGDVLPASFIIANGGYQAWADTFHDFVIGGRTVKYPVFGIVPSPDTASNSNFSVIASTTVISVDVKAGEILHSGGYLMEAKRAIKAGEAIPTVLLIRNGTYSIISIETAPETKDKDDAAKLQPWLTIFDEHLQPSERTLSLEVWRLSNKTVGNLTILMSQPIFPR